MAETNYPSSAPLPFGGEEEPPIAAPLPDELEELRGAVEELREEFEEHAAGGDGAPGSGNVTGPASAVSGNVVLFNGTTGKLIKDGGPLGSAAFAAATDYATAMQGSDSTAHLGRTDNPHGVTKAQVGLGSADNTSDATKPISTATQTALNLKAAAADLAAHAASTANPHATTTAQVSEVTNLYYTNARADARISLQKAAANGLATLGADAKIPTSQLPALAVTDTFVAASQAAQLGLPAEEGDVAVRTDLSKSFIHNGGTAGTMADWQELLAPAGGVASVNGMTGAVTVATVTGNAGTATALQTARTINGTGFDGTGNITVAAAAGTLTGSALAAGVTSSSLTSVGTLANLSVAGTIAGSVNGNAGTVTTISGRIAQGANIAITGAGTAASPYSIAGAAGSVTSVNVTAPAAGITISGGPVTSSGALTLALADDLAALEGLTATGLIKRTGTSAWAAAVAGTDYVVPSGGITGNAATATALQTARAIDGVGFNGTGDITVIAPATAAASGKATPVDADALPLADSAAGNTLKKLTWANLKATVKTWFDTLYLALVAPGTTGNVLTSNGTAWTSAAPAGGGGGGGTTPVYRVVADAKARRAYSPAPVIGDIFEESSTSHRWLVCDVTKLTEDAGYQSLGPVTQPAIVAMPSLASSSGGSGPNYYVYGYFNIISDLPVIGSCYVFGCPGSNMMYPGNNNLYVYGYAFPDSVIRIYGAAKFLVAYIALRHLDISKSPDMYHVGTGVAGELQNFNISGNPLLTVVNLANQNLSAATVDHIFMALDAAGLTGGTVNLSGGTSASPTALSGTARSNLMYVKGWTVSHN